jgi:hypothetical protein
VCDAGALVLPSPPVRLGEHALGRGLAPVRDEWAWRQRSLFQAPHGM